MARPSSAKAFEAALARKAAMQAARCAGTKGPSAKGIGPNKACGHKGGIRRQGSKRGQHGHGRAALLKARMHGDFFTTRRAVGLWAEMRVN